MTGNLTFSQAEGIVPGVSPQVYAKADFDRIAHLVRQEAGIVLSDGKRMLAYSRLAPLLREAGTATFCDYLDLLENNAAMRVKTIASLTTNHTYFNREAHHYDHFNEIVRPDLVRRAAAGENVRIWSAGCSSGEEIWTLMMYLLGEERSAGKAISNSKIVTLASDLAEHAVTAAKKGSYPADAMKDIPQKLRDNWCKQVGDTIEIGPEMRTMLRFRQLNLLRQWPFKEQFDVVFCRNVMIYFDQPSKEQLVARIARQLRPGGYLYIGHSERATGEGANLLTPVGPTVYQRNMT